MNANPYETPEAEILEPKTDIAATFATLNFWRKLYLLLMWFGVAIGCSIFVHMAFTSNEAGVSLFSAVYVIIAIALCVWTHAAIVKRKRNQLLILTIINIFPFMNIVGALIMLSILRVTKKEHLEYNVI